MKTVIINASPKTQVSIVGGSRPFISQKKNAIASSHKLNFIQIKQSDGFAILQWRIFF
jgi:hypothetical protein